MIWYMPLLIFGLGIISQITAYWGPKKLLIISGGCSFLLGICMSLLKSFSYENFIFGLFLGILLSVVDVFFGLYTRYWRMRGKKSIDEYLKKNRFSKKI